MGCCFSKKSGRGGSGPSGGLPVLFREALSKMTRIGSDAPLRPVRLWNIKNNKTEYLLDLSKGKETIDKVNKITWKIIYAKYKVNSHNLDTIPLVK